MWDMKEKNMMYRHQSMGLNSAGPRSSSLENMKPSSTVNSLNWHCLAEAPRKRKAVDLDVGGDVSNHSTSYCRNLRGNLGNLLHGETNPQHNISALQAIGSREKYPEVSHSSLSVNSSNSHSPYEYQIQNVNNLSMSFQKEDDKLHRVPTDSPNPWFSHHKEQSLSKTVKKSIGGILNLPGSQHLALETATASQAEVSKLWCHSNQIGGFTKETLPVLGPKIGINQLLGNNNLPSNPSHYSQNMNSYNFTFLGSPSLKMGSNRLYPIGGNSVQDIDKNGLLEVKEKAQDMGHGEEKSISISTTNCMQISAGNGREKSHVSYQNSNSETRSVNNPRSDTGDAPFDVRVEEHNRPVLLQLPVIAQSSASAQAIVDYRLLNKSAHIFKDFENRIPEKENEPIIEANNQFVDDGSPLKYDAGLDKRPSELGDGMAFNLNEQNKLAGGKLSQVVAQKLWDGSLQLNTSIKVSAVAFFKSGEKAQDINWSQHIEIKGKVRLQAFEKFIQELPRSRSRTIMVISLCWKIGSSKDGLKGMKEVSKGYRDSERVGFAQIAPGVDLYVCPHSDTIIMILAKYGFFKGMAAVEEDHDSLIGCVIWRRGLLSSKSDTMKLEKKEDPLQGQPLNSPESSTMENNSPWTMNNAPEIKQAAIRTRDPDGVPSTLKSETKPTAPESKIIESNKGSNKTSSIRTTIGIITSSIPCNSPIAPVQINSTDEPDSNSLQDLREQAEISNNHLVEPDLDSKPRLPVLRGPHQISPEVQHSNTQPRKDSHTSSSLYTDPVPELTSIDFPHLPSRLPAFQKPNLNIKQNPIQSVLKAEFSTMNISERRKLDTTIEMATSALPGPPPLPPEVWQRNILSNRDKDSLEGLSQPCSTVMHVAEPKKAAMHHEPTGPIFLELPRMIPQATQRSATFDQDDDLPEFDFSSACGVSQAPVSKFPWSNDGTQLGDAPPLSEKLPVDVIKNANEDKPPATPIPKPIEAMQKPQVSSFPDIAFSAPRAGDAISENKEAAKAMQSASESHIERASKIPSSMTSGCSSPRNRWDDDDDDMPEWCPPDLENLQQSKLSITTRLPFLVPKPFSGISAPRPSIPAQAPPSFCPSQNQGFLKRDQAGILGPCPASGNSATLPQTRPAAGRVPTGLRPSVAHNLSNSSGAQARKFNSGCPSRVGRRLRRR